MAVQLYDLFFGSVNAGGAPAFLTFSDSATGDAIPPPALTDLGGGFYRFSVDWGTVGATAIRYAASLNGVELGDTIHGNAPPASISVQPGAQNLAQFSTARDIISRAAIQLKLVAQPIADPYASTNPDIALLCELLRQAGDDLNTEHEWSNLRRTATFETDGVATSYVLPADYHAMLDQTLWNRSTRLPGVGPLSPQQTAAFQARLVSVVVNVVYEIRGGLIVFPIVPPSGAVIAFGYQSSYWAQSEGAGAPDKEHPTSATDTVLYDPDLMIAAVKLRWLEEGGWDTAKAQERYNQKLEHAIGKNDPAPVLRLGGGARNWLDRMIDGRNVSEGNWPA